MHHLPVKATVLDLGCGTGEPIARFFIHHGHQITGVDFSEPMLDIARKRFPNHTWLNQDIRTFNTDTTYDGVIAWGSFFTYHKMNNEHISIYSQGSSKPGGAALITIGHIEGEVTGSINGRTVYHSSLSLREYSSIIEKLGLVLVAYALNDSRLPRAFCSAHKKAPSDSRRGFLLLTMILSSRSNNHQESSSSLDSVCSPDSSSNSFLFPLSSHQSLMVQPDSTVNSVHSFHRTYWYR